MCVERNEYDRIKWFLLYLDEIEKVKTIYVFLYDLLYFMFFFIE